MLSKRGGLGGGLAAKPAANNAAVGKSRRTALGDISNRIKVQVNNNEKAEDRLAKKTVGQLFLSFLLKVDLLLLGCPSFLHSVHCCFNQ